MASKLCCTADQESRSGSPDLPNARVSAATSNQPLLSKDTGSPSSHFTSARSEELHELRQIFEDAQDESPHKTSPLRRPRPHSSRRSIYSLHSLHKMTSMRSLLRRKFSKDLPRKKSNASTRQHAEREAIKEEPDTIVKHANVDKKHKLKVTKDDLRKDLLSDKDPAEGGYDSDAEVLDVVARNIGKSTPTKRPSIHSVEWAPSSGGKSTPGSSKQRQISVELKSDVQPYQIETTQPLSSRFGQVFSTPNLRADGLSEREQKLRRSYSAASMGLPKPSPLSPLRLPSLTRHDKDGVPWSEVMSESLRLSQFPAPPRHPGLKPGKTVVSERNLNDKIPNNSSEQVRTDDLDQNSSNAVSSLAPRAIEIRIQQPTSINSPRPSTSVRRDFRENAQPTKDASADNPETRDGDGDEDEDNHRRSVHLYSMRISHHLRSGSLLSWDQLADAPELPSPPRPLRQRTVSDQSRFSQLQTQLARHERQTSSSGFASEKVSSKWGRVLNDDRALRADVASSIYSSRPQSPPDSFGGSIVNLSRAGSGYQNFSHSSLNLRSLRRSNSFPTDNEETPRPLRRYGVTNLAAVRDVPASTSLLAQPPLLARKNSVADTKVSKFREEFSPSPPRKKLTPSTSIMKFLNPKRLSLRSLSEANLQPDAPMLIMDGPSDTLPVPADRERRQSRSLVSLHAEQKALDKNKGTNHVWNEALKAHQEEKASMFRPENKNLAVHASPFRERSGSVSSRRASFQESIRSLQDERNAVAEPSNTKRLSAPMFASNTFDDHIFGRNPALATRRTATSGRDPLSPEQELADAFDKQGDGPDVVGAWGRFPSHTRADRTVSVGLRERVGTRDFALESAVRFASGRDHGHDEDMVDPTFRIPSPPLMPGEKKRKKKVGSGKMPKSHSMTFGRKLIKNYYSGMFKSSSTEFRRHGRGHRSSIASGGMLENPELELLPEVFMSDEYDGAGGSPSERSDKQVVRRHSERHCEAKAKGKLPIGDSMATLRPRRNSSAPNLKDLANLHDGANNSGDANNRARIWSAYYDACVPSFPRPSTDNDFTLEDIGGPSCTEGRRGSHFHTMPERHTKHSRNTSQLSHLSAGSRWSGRPRSLSGVEDDHGCESRSHVSVRRSTMDLISKFKEQENTEHERVLSLTRAESRRDADFLTAPSAVGSGRRMSIMDMV